MTGREVWKQNLEDEFKIIRRVVQIFPYVFMDAKFASPLSKQVQKFTSPEQRYEFIRNNVNLLKLLQITLKFLDHSACECGSFWKFNMKYVGAPAFKIFEENGIKPNDFAELLMTSGIVLIENTRWLSYYSYYDVGFLLKYLTAKPLPKKYSEFSELVRLYFPNIINISALIQET